MIIQYRQRIAPPLIQGREPSLEIHLPELIGSFMLESLPRLMLLALRRIDLSRPLQNPMDRACRRQSGFPLIPEHPTYFPRAPAWPYMSNLQDFAFHLC